MSCNDDNHNNLNFSHNDYVSYNNGTRLKCTLHPKNAFSPLISSKWSGLTSSNWSGLAFASTPPIEFNIAKYGTLKSESVDLSTNLQKIGPYISVGVTCFSSSNSLNAIGAD